MFSLTGDAAPLVGTERISESERCLRIGLTWRGTPCCPDAVEDEVEYDRELVFWFFFATGVAAVKPSLSSVVDFRGGGTGSTAVCKGP